MEKRELTFKYLVKKNMHAIMVRRDVIVVDDSCDPDVNFLMQRVRTQTDHTYYENDFKSSSTNLPRRFFLSCI